MNHGFTKHIVTDAIRHALDKDVDWEEALLLAFDEPNHAGTKVIMEITRIADKAHRSAYGHGRLHSLGKRKAALLVLAGMYARIPDPATEANR